MFRNNNPENAILCVHRTKYSTGLFITASALAIFSAQAAYAQDNAPPAAAASVEQVTVTGSLIANPAFAAPTPVTTVGEQQIQERAPATVFDVIKDIPAFNSTSGPSANSSGAQNASKANLNLRNLGATRTLVLIDGERHVPDGQTNVFDTNLIPTSLIQRIDIVTGGASATYGSDAVAGVVNFILDKQYEGFKGDWHVGISQYGDGIEFNPSLAYGTSMFGGKGHFIIGGDITINEGTGTKYSRGWGRLEPGVFTTPLVRPAGEPAQLVSNHVETSAYNSSGLIVSGPLSGTVFLDGGVTQQLQYGTIVGSTEMCCGTGDYGSTLNPDEALEAAYDRGAVLARFGYDIDEDTEAHIQFNYGHLNTFGDSFGAQVPNFNKYVVLANNPFLPANISSYLATNNITSFQYSATRDGDLSSISSRNNTDSLQGNIGVQGKFSTGFLGDWKWNADFGLGAASFVPNIHNTPIQANFFESAYVVPGPGGVPVCGPVATNPYFNAQNPIEKALLLATLQPGCVPYDIFGNNVAQNKAANAYFNSASEEDNEFRQYTFNLNFTGAPVTLPAGDVSVAFGYDFRRDAINVVNCAECMLNALMNQNYSSYIGDIIVNEFYGEADIPILKDVPFFKTLGVNIAARNTTYSTSGNVTTWKAGFTWDIDDSIRLRGTRSHDIRAPNVNELFNPGSQGNANVVDQVTGTSGYIKTDTVGSTKLQPEVGETYTAGVVFQPSWDWASGLNISVDYYNIKMTKVISTLPTQTLLNDYYLRGAASPYAQYITPDPTNSVFVSTVLSPELNLNSQKTDGVDVEVDYIVPEDFGLPGTLSMRALGNWIDQFKVQTPTTNINSVGQIAAPRMSWNILLTHRIDRFTTDFMIRYTSPTIYDPTLVGLDGLTPGTALYNATAALPNSINRNIYPGALYYNASFAYDILTDREDGKKLQLYLNINDIANIKPPLIATTLNGGPYDLIGRYFKVGARFAF